MFSGVNKLFNSVEYPIIFSKPDRLAPSGWIVNIPFGMFLVDVLRPRVIVELGTQYGVSYCAFCQAVKSIGIPAQCYAVDTWEGDRHAGVYGPEIYDELRNYHDPLYGSFSRLIQTTFDNALSNFDDGSIELLHIDGMHTYEAVKHDFEGWLPKMSSRGVVLFHDICVRRDDFGVWRLWEEIKSRYPHFELPYGNGLGLIAVENTFPGALEALFEPVASDNVSVQELFYQTGMSLEKDVLIDVLHSRVNDRDQTIRNLETQLQQAIDREEIIKNSIASIQTTMTWKSVQFLRETIKLAGLRELLRRTFQSSSG